jgi:hypothetical protein
MSKPGNVKMFHVRLSVGGNDLALEGSEGKTPLFPDGRHVTLRSKNIVPYVHVYFINILTNAVTKNKTKLKNYVSGGSL